MTVIEADFTNFPPLALLIGCDPNRIRFSLAFPSLFMLIIDNFLQPPGEGWTLVGHRGAFGRSNMDSASEDMRCVAFGARNDICYTGSSKGSIYLWNGQSLGKKVKAHEGAGC